MLKYLFLAGAVACALFPVSAEARHKTTLHPECNITMPCIAPYASTPDQVRVTRGRYVARQMGFGVAIEKRAVRVPKAATNRSQNITRNITVAVASIVAHPEGCPRSAFCGCGAAVRIFGSPIRSLWLAANWFKFPRATPSAGMVAVRRHHVFVLEQHLGGDTWLAYDANSGGHATRVHARSIAGYSIVNPHG